MARPTIPLVDAASMPSAKPAVLRMFAAGKLYFPAPLPLSLYVHFPWCLRKCPYCDFNSHELPASGIPEDQFLDALRTDLELSLPLIWGRPIRSVFIGGGTPSLLSAQGVDRLLADIRARVPMTPDAEVTLEANPGTFEADKFRQFRDAGINRLSIGVQTFDDARLTRLGRVHSSHDACAALELAATRFENFNVDLMYALPGQTLAECEGDVARALGFAPRHLSLYHLSIEPNTVFAKYPPELPDDDLAALMQDAIEALTLSRGYERYEVSAYSRPGWQSHHNTNYWEFGDYLGIGPGAHSKLSFPERVIRQVRVRQPGSYLEACAKGAPWARDDEVLVDELGFEFMLNALRLRHGVPASLFAERTGLALSSIRREIDLAVARGLLEADPRTLCATPLGWRFLNDLQTIFLSDRTEISET